MTEARRDKALCGISSAARYTASGLGVRWEMESKCVLTQPNPPASGICRVCHVRKCG
jgi:hypothetical protein